jgi:hypothetical protein
VAQVSKPAVSPASKPAHPHRGQQVWKPAAQQTWKSAARQTGLDRRPGGKYRGLADSVNGYIKINANKMLAKWKWIEAYWGVGKGEGGARALFSPQKGAKGAGRPAAREKNLHRSKRRKRRGKGTLRKTNHWVAPLPFKIPLHLRTSAWCAGKRLFIVRFGLHRGVKSARLTA